MPLFISPAFLGFVARANGQGQGGLLLRGNIMKNFCWNDVKPEYIEMAAFNTKIEELKKAGYQPIIADNPMSGFNIYGEHFTVSSSGKILRYYDKGYHEIRLGSGDNVAQPIGGRQARLRFNSYVFEEYGKTLTQMFGKIGTDYYDFIRTCVPSQISWSDYNISGFVLRDCHKADVSSAFPSEASKSLPDFRYHKECYEYVMPNNEYPFAFYDNGGLCFIEEDGTVIDTQQWDRSYYSLERQYNSRKETSREKHYVSSLLAPKTILCKRSKYNLAAVFRKLYSLRETNPIAKATMNMSIGHMWRRQCPNLAHLAAVTIARCNERMINAWRQIEGKGGTVVLVATDSIAWRGNVNLIPTTTIKDFGNLVMEYESCEMIVMSPKCYQLRTKEGQTKSFWAGKNREYTKKLAFGSIRNATEIYPANVEWDINALKWRTVL